MLVYAVVRTQVDRRRGAGWPRYRRRGRRRCDQNEEPEVEPPNHMSYSSSTKGKDRRTRGGTRKF